tara:strand:- start:11346 stop:12200 length:855 start_codon:yes stop_codon:yes gene_type:complete
MLLNTTFMIKINLSLIVVAVLVYGCNDKSKEKNTQYDTYDNYKIEKEESTGEEFDVLEFSNTVFNIWDYGSSYDLVNTQYLNEYQLEQAKTNPFYPNWQFAYQDFNNDNKYDIAVVVKSKRDNTIKILVFEKEKVGYSNAKIFNTRSDDFLVFAPLKGLSLVEENSFVLMGKTENEHLFHTYRFDKWLVFNKSKHEQRKKKTAKNEDKTNYVTDGTRCLNCKLGVYKNGICDMCSSASIEKTRESYNKLAKCFLCKGTRFERSKTNPNEFRLCPACKGRGVIIP